MINTKENKNGEGKGENKLSEKFIYHYTPTYAPVLLFKIGFIKIKTLYSLIAPTCFDTTRVITREHSFFLAKITG
jgi:hypothetical protein